MEEDTDVATVREVRNLNICTAVTLSEKLAFQAFCHSHETNPSAMLRLMLAKVCPGQIEPGESSERATKTNPLFLRLRADEMKDVRQRAKSEGVSSPSWVRRVVLAVLRKAPAYTKQEEIALLSSNAELLAIGRNINQIAHHLNIHPDATDRITIAAINDLSALIRRHWDSVSALLNASWGRYSLDELEDIAE